MTATENQLLECLDTATLCRLTGVNRSTLDYWIRTGLVKPSLRRAPGKRRTRIWTLHDAVVVRTIASLRIAGASLQKVRKAKRHLDDNQNGLKPSTTLLWDGSDIRMLEEWGEILSLVSQPGQGILHVLALPIGTWQLENQQHAMFIRPDNLRFGVPSLSREDALAARSSSA